MSTASSCPTTAWPTGRRVDRSRRCARRSSPRRRRSRTQSAGDSGIHTGADVSGTGAGCRRASAGCDRLRPSGLDADGARGGGQHHRPNSTDARTLGSYAAGRVDRSALAEVQSFTAGNGPERSCVRSAVGRRLCLYMSSARRTGTEDLATDDQECSHDGISRETPNPVAGATSVPELGSAGRRGWRLFARARLPRHIGPGDRLHGQSCRCPASITTYPSRRSHCCRAARTHDDRPAHPLGTGCRGGWR